MPIHQVTHVNHVTSPTDAPPIDPSEPLAALAAAEERLGKRKFFVRNPKLVKQDAGEFQQKLEWGRNALDGDGRMGQAEQWKAAANALFADGKSHAALLGYVVGVWYLRSGRPACPMAIAHAVASAKDSEAEFSTNGIDELAAWLPIPAAEQSVSAADESEADGITPLRRSLHLNAAAAALKLSAWAVAKAACEVVLSEDATNGKALFRLAKALEGMGELKQSITTLTGLIRSDPKNREARTLLDAVKRRQAEEKEKFKNMFANGDAPTASEAPAADAAPTFQQAYEAHVRERELNPRIYGDEAGESSADAERARQQFHALGVGASSSLAEQAEEAPAPLPVS